MRNKIITILVLAIGLIGTEVMLEHFYVGKVPEPNKAMAYYVVASVFMVIIAFRLDNNASKMIKAINISALLFMAGWGVLMGLISLFVYNANYAGIWFFITVWIIGIGGGYIFKKKLKI